MDAHETNPEHTALRELREETGYEPAAVIKTATIAPNPATHNNVMHCYVATGCELLHQQSLDENEELEIMLVSLDELKELLRNNKILQSLHVASVLYGLMHLGEINY